MKEAMTSSSTTINGHGSPRNGVIAKSFGELTSNDMDPYPTPYHSRSASLSPLPNGYSCPPFQMHNEEIVNHLYHAGFQTGNYADTILHVHQNTYRLHAVILSQSPYLVHLMSTSPQTGGQRIIYAYLEQDPEVTQEGFAIALGYLYSSASLALIRPENARSVLAAGCLLGGMEDLCSYAYNTCRQSITIDSITEWLDIVDPDGLATPELPPTSVFGQYAQRLRDDVFQFLVVTLPDILEVYPRPDSPTSPIAGGGRDKLLRIYSRVPFDLFKAAIESPAFHIGSDQTRFKFAKEAIELRKRRIAQATGGEETVVLAFGGANFGGSAVHVTRKMRKRPLWKVTS